MYMISVLLCRACLLLPVERHHNIIHFVPSSLHDSPLSWYLIVSRLTDGALILKDIHLTNSPYSCEQELHFCCRFSFRYGIHNSILVKRQVSLRHDRTHSFWDELCSLTDLHSHAFMIMINSRLSCISNWLSIIRFNLLMQRIMQWQTTN